MRPYIHTPLLVLDPICADLLHAASFCEFICASILLRLEAADVLGVLGVIQHLQVLQSFYLLFCIDPWDLRGRVS